MKKIWMPFYPGHYLADTGHLTAEQHGAYLLLIMHYWCNEGLPDDHEQLRRIARLSHHRWKANEKTLQKFFKNGWCHSRLDQELAKAKKISAQKAFSGLKGAWIRHGKYHPNGWHMPTQSQSHRYIRKKESEKEG